jgi:hypothetical protein
MCLPSGALTPWLQISKRVPETSSSGIASARAGFSFNHSFSPFNIEEGQAEFIQNVFRFGELVVSDVMVHRTEMITVCADEALYRCQAWRSRSLRGARDRPLLILWHASRQRALNSRFSMWFTKTARAGQEGQARQADLRPRVCDREGLHRKQRQSRRSARFPQREVVGMSAAQFWPYCQS